MSSESVRGRLDAATPGPWIAAGAATWRSARLDWRGRIYDNRNALVARQSGVANPDPRPDSYLIAHAPTDLAAALDVIEAAGEVYEFLEHATGCPMHPDSSWKDQGKPCDCGLGAAQAKYDAAVDAFEALS